MKQTKNRIIQKVWQYKRTGQKCVTIPKEADIKAGDFVEIEKKEVD